MRMRTYTVIMIGLVIAAVLGGCSGTREQSALYILEELETAAAVEDHEDRIERLEIFVQNHPEHRYRVRAYERILETIAEEIGDMERAENYFDEIMARESDATTRGILLYEKFGFMHKNDKQAAITLAKEWIDGQETYYRLYLYIGYYLYGEEGLEELTERYFAKAASLGRNSYERSQAFAVLSSYLDEKGKRGTALEYLRKAGNNPYANELRGKIFWEEGSRKEALESYMNYAAVIPAARESLHLDSLYALEYPGATDLDRQLLDRRIADEGTIPAETFVDLNGKRHDLSKYRGTKLVVNIWSPT